jgi:large subunit ribosomal protein L17
MRHNASGRKLGRTTAHRLALFRNQLSSLVAQERIITTISKAKELRPLAERVVTQGKRGTVHARRLVGRWIQNRDLIKKLFDEIAPRFASRAGGYLRIVRLGSRQGDGAEMAVLEFVDFQLKKKAAPSPAEEKGKKGKETKEAKGGTDEAAEEAKPAKPAKSKAPARKSAQPKGEGKKVKAEPKPKSKPGKAPAAAKKSTTPRKAGSS